MKIEEESERLRKEGKPRKKRWSELAALTRELLAAWASST